MVSRESFSVTQVTFAWLETGRLSDMAQSTRPPNISLLVRNITEFDAFSVNIADEITKEELEKMKFLCARQNNNNYLPLGKLDAIENQREFLDFLRQHGKIRQDDMSYLEWLLRTVGRIDLADGKILVKTYMQIDLLRLKRSMKR